MKKLPTTPPLIDSLVKDNFKRKKVYIPRIIELFFETRQLQLKNIWNKKKKDEVFDLLFS